MSTIVVEQLFEDTRDVSHSKRDGGEMKFMSLPREKQSFIKKTAKPTRRSDAIFDSRKHSTLTSPVPKPYGMSASASPRTKSRNHSIVSLPESPVRFPISYDLALGLYGSKLTPAEREEIQSYENIYYLGLAASKMNVGTSYSPDIYDDEDSFYRAIPHDQIAYRYEILDRPALGKGTFAQVVKAYDHKENRKVAIKIVRNERVYLKQSREELRILNILRKMHASSSHNIVQFYEFFMFRNHMCITFELLGMNLYQVLKKNGHRGLGSAKILLIARGTLNCLELLYKSRIIHCDIKPENIMLRRNGDFTSLRVGDFGSSCYEQQQMYHYVQSRFYRAPEVMLGMRYGPAIDMWSLGCVLGELSIGYPIFMGKNEQDQLAAIEEVLGKIPPVMMSKTKTKLGSIPNGRGAPGSKRFSSIVHGDDTYKDFVRQILEWDPLILIRPSPTEIKEHVWVKGRKSSSSSRGSGTIKVFHKSHKARHSKST